MNRLGSESSPYLRQHADNPVDWWPWSDAAFAVARDRDVPILLSIGYSSCHWCHVMAHESFADPATAEVMNAEFVNIKVDREERPDVDAIYMDAVQRLTGRGGWPMTMFLTPDGKPFFGGTYFPKTPRPGMPAFTQILQAVAAAWRDNRSEVLDQGTTLTELIGQANTFETNDGARPDAGVLSTAADLLIARADPVQGGFGPAPKFPMAMALRFLAVESTRTDNDPARTVVTTALDAMAAGGIHDHVGGGFHRYSTDARWLVPHFEKMLYDQATLLRAYTAGYALTGSETYRRVATGIVEYVLRDLQDPDGGWYAAEDADSEHIEGKFFCWQPEDLHAVLGADADAVVAWANVTPTGNFHDPHTGFRGNILHAADGNPDTPPAVLATFDALRAARSARVRPGLDDKVLLGWNALFARALAEAAITFDVPEWLDVARRNVTFLTEAFATDSGFARSWQGEARHPAVLEDVAALLAATVTLAELDGRHWLDVARRVAAALEPFRDPDGPGWFTTTRTVDLIVRPKEISDNAVPSGNALAAEATLRLAHLTQEPHWATTAEALVAGLGPRLAPHALGFGYLLEAVQRVVLPTREIVIVGDRTTQHSLGSIALQALGANDIVVLTEADQEADVHVLEGRVGPGAPHPRAYVCIDGTCDLPVDTPAGLRAQLSSP
jgi:hypothetical protein